MGCCEHVLAWLITIEDRRMRLLLLGGSEGGDPSGVALELTLKYELFSHDEYSSIDLSTKCGCDG